MPTNIEKQAAQVRDLREAKARLRKIPRRERLRIMRRYHLRQGVAKECKVHPTLVSMVLHGNAQSARVLLAIDRAFAAVIRAESGEVAT